MTRIQWRKSSRSASGAGQCVEVAATGSDVAVRDSKHKTGPVLVCDRGSWNGFLASISR